MAEAVLCENPTDPPFPYQLAAECFQWVPRYIDFLTAKRHRHRRHGVKYIPVLSRARTSTLITGDVLDVCTNSILRLNSTLKSLPSSADANHHLLRTRPTYQSRIFRCELQKPSFYLESKSYSARCRSKSRLLWPQPLYASEMGLSSGVFVAGFRGPRFCRLHDH